MDEKQTQQEQQTRQRERLQEQHYLLSINKKQVFLASLAFSLILALFFVLGITIGKKAFSSGAENYIHAQSELPQLLPAQVSGEKSDEKKELMQSDESADIAKDTKDYDKPLQEIKNSELIFDNYLDSKKLLAAEESSLDKKKVSNVINQDETLSIKKIEKKAKKRKKTLAKNENKGDSRAREKKLAKSKDFYFINLAKTKDLKKAGKIVSEFKNKKYSVVMHTRLSKDKGDGAVQSQEYLIRIGLYKDKKIAQTHLDEIKANSIFEDASIARYKKSL